MTLKHSNTSCGYELIGYILSLSIALKYVVYGNQNNKDSDDSVFEGNQCELEMLHLVSRVNIKTN